MEVGGHCYTETLGCLPRSCSCPCNRCVEEQLFQTGIFQLSTDLCQQANGAGDPWPQEKIDKVLTYLKKRLAKWHHPHPNQAVRDALAKAYVEAALHEVRPE